MPISKERFAQRLHWFSSSSSSASSMPCLRHFNQRKKVGGLEVFELSIQARRLVDRKGRKILFGRSAMQRTGTRCFYTMILQVHQQLPTITYFCTMSYARCRSRSRLCAVSICLDLVEFDGPRSTSPGHLGWNIFVCRWWRRIWVGSYMTANDRLIPDIAYSARRGRFSRQEDKKLGRTRRSFLSHDVRNLGGHWTMNAQ